MTMQTIQFRTYEEAESALICAGFDKSFDVPGHTYFVDRQLDFQPMGEEPNIFAAAITDLYSGGVQVSNWSTNQVPEWKAKRDKRSSAWRFTVRSKDDPRIAELKKEIRIHNMEVCTEPTPKYQKVSIKGRTGPLNPKGKELTRKQRRDGSIPHDYADHFDVYIYEYYPRGYPIRQSSTFHGMTPAEIDVLLPPLRDILPEPSQKLPELPVLPRLEEKPKPEPVVAGQSERFDQRLDDLITLTRADGMYDSEEKVKALFLKGAKRLLDLV